MNRMFIITYKEEHHDRTMPSAIFDFVWFLGMRLDAVKFILQSSHFAMRNDKHSQFSKRCLYSVFVMYAQLIDKVSIKMSGKITHWPNLKVRSIRTSDDPTALGGNLRCENYYALAWIGQLAQSDDRYYGPTEDGAKQSCISRPNWGDRSLKCWQHTYNSAGSAGVYGWRQ